MEVLCKSDYQDVYRIKDGVLLVVNKFKYIYRADGYRMIAYANRTNSKTYQKGCKDLKVLTKRHLGKCPDKNLEIGQVIYHYYPVELAPKEEWNYQIKTTGNLFSGTSEEVLKYIEDIINIIK